MVAIDGRSSAGKSTLASRAVAELEALGAAPALLHTDDFLRGSDTRAAIEAPLISDYYDWSRLRRDALDPLLAGRAASFRAFDWETDALRPGEVRIAASELIVLEGVGSSAPALAGAITWSVLVETPARERNARTRRRIPQALWDDAWLAAERRYFATRTPARFDLVLSGADCDSRNDTMLGQRAARD